MNRTNAVAVMIQAVLDGSNLVVSWAMASGTPMKARAATMTARPIVVRIGDIPFPLSSSLWFFFMF